MKIQSYNNYALKSKPSKNMGNTISYLESLHPYQIVSNCI